MNETHRLWGSHTPKYPLHLVKIKQSVLFLMHLGIKNIFPFHRQASFYKFYLPLPRQKVLETESSPHFWLVE